MFLCWAFSDNSDAFDLDKEVDEDAKARKRRIQSELARALAVLGVKHSTFYSMLAKNRHSEVKQMLKEALQERSEDLVEKSEEEINQMSQDFNIHLELVRIWSEFPPIFLIHLFLGKKHCSAIYNMCKET